MSELFGKNTTISRTFPTIFLSKWVYLCVSHSIFFVSGIKPASRHERFCKKGDCKRGPVKETLTVKCLGCLIWFCIHFEYLNKLFSVKLVHLTFSFTFLNPTSAKDQNQMQFVLPNGNISTCSKMRYYFGGGLVGASWTHAYLNNYFGYVYNVYQS